MRPKPSSTSVRGEVGQGQGVATVVGDRDQPGEFVAEARLAKGGQAHDFVLALVDPKAQIRGESGVEHAERVRIGDGRQSRQAIAVAAPHAGRYVLADCVDHQDSGALVGADQKRAGSVALVVIAKLDLASLDVERVGDLIEDPQLGAELGPDGAGKLPPRPGIGPEQADQNPLELAVGVFVKNHGVEVLGAHPAEREARSGGPHRQRRVVFDARQSLFLHGAYDLAIDDERCGGVVIIRRDAQDRRHQVPSVGFGSVVVGAVAGGESAPGDSRQPVRSGRAIRTMTAMGAMAR